MKKNNWKNAIRAARTTAISMALVSLAVLLGACEDPLTAIAVENVRLASLPEYGLLVEPASDGSISPPAGTYKVRDGEPTTISASANATFTFMGWSQTGGTGTATFSDFLAPSTTVRVTGGDVSIKAIIDDTHYSISVASQSGGTVSPTSFEIDKGDESGEITATADINHAFSEWTVSSGLSSGIGFNSSSAANPVRITANAGDATIMANYVPATFSLALTTSGPGTISTPSASPVPVTYNVPYAITAGNPTSRGYYFSGWTNTGGTGTATFANPAAASTTVTVSGGNVTITANYSPITATLTRRGYLQLNDVDGYTEQRLDDINDLIYETGYIYAVGSFSSTAKIMKIDVSTPTNPSFDSSLNIVANSVANEIVKEGTYFYVGVSGTGGDRYRTAIKSGSGLNTFTDMGHNVDVKQLTGGGWIANSNIISRYQVRETIDLNSDMPLADILFIPGFNYLYVTEEAGMGSNGYAEVYYSSGDTIYLENSTALTDRSPGKMVYNGGYYIYSASGASGIITLNADYESFNFESALTATTNTGQPNDVDISGNYLLSIGTGTTDRIAIYDIHSNNGSNSNPYYLNGINRYTNGVTALDADGSYVYTIEGSYLVIYQITTNVP